MRGDRAFALGDYAEALAEYRLALQQGASDADILARAAHACVQVGRVDEARDFYRAAAQLDPFYADQAVADLIHVARAARERGDRLGVSAAVQAALEFRQGINVADLALPLARHHLQNAEFARALPFYQAALGSVSPDSAPEILFEAAQAYEATGDCRRALAFFEEYREKVGEEARTEALWHIGNCSFELALQLLDQGQQEEALRRLQTTITLGEPRNLLPRAYFEKGELLAGRGECEAAIEAFRQIQIVDPNRNSPLTGRALQRIDEIRFGHPSIGPPRAGRCG